MKTEREENKSTKKKIEKKSRKPIDKEILIKI